MQFELSTSEELARAVNDLRLGFPIYVEGYTIFALETLKPLFYKRFSSENLIVLLSAERALDLHLSHDPSSPAALQLPRDYPFEKAKALADPMLDFDYPMKGPLQQSALSRELKTALLDFTKSAKLLPAVLLLPNNAARAGFSLENVEDFLKERGATTAVARARVPLRVSKDNHLTLFRTGLIADENYVLEIGHPDKAKAPLVRLHSECFTGDCLGSMKCDCGPQLQNAMALMAENGGGYLLYLTQEGRGIGLANKIRAYALQDQGYDTVEANLKLGFLDDERDFATAADILSTIGVKRLKLITNNPKKVQKLEEKGFEIVERVPLKVGRNPENEDYLEVKATKSGHFL